MDFLLRPDLIDSREEFSIKNVAKDAGKGISTAAKDVGKGVGTAANAAKNKLVPFLDFFKKIWAWLRWACLALVLCCCLSSCVFLGIPQMAFRAVSDATSTTSG